MAQRRLLNKSLGTSSKKYANLNHRAGELADFCHALYPLIMVNCDDHGRLAGDAFSIKMNVFPISRHSEEEFEEALQAMHDVHLITLYSVDGNRYLCLHNFRKEQPGIKYVANPIYPEPPAQVVINEQFTGTHRITPSFSQEEKKNRKEEEKKKQKHAADAAAVDPHPSAESVRLSELLCTAIARRDPHSKAAKLPDQTRWARDIDKILTIDGRRAKDVEAVIQWCQSDGCFWGPNILSGRKLREKFDTLFGQMHRLPVAAKNGSARPAATDIYLGQPESNGNGHEMRAEYANFIRNKPLASRNPDEANFLAMFDSGAMND